MNGARHIKLLTWVQLLTVAGVILAAWIYVRPQQPVSAATCGMIDGILFSTDNPSVMIDGQILKVGDSIYGVEVVEINRCIVTFEKYGKRWEQRVHQRANPAWDEPEPVAGNSNNVPNQTTSP